MNNDPAPMVLIYLGAARLCNRHASHSALSQQFAIASGKIRTHNVQVMMIQAPKPG
jgi:hypothetical protein